MAGGRTHRWEIGAAWEASVAVTAAAYDVPAELIAAPSRGRGPRPPQQVWSAKKMAVHLTVIIADCDYASLARRLGLHRDTVASHCADMREAAADSELNEISAVALERLARFRLQQIGSQRIDALRAHLAMMSEALGELSEIGGAFGVAPFAVSSDGPPTTHPTDFEAAKKNVVRAA